MTFNYNTMKCFHLMILCCLAVTQDRAALKRFLDRENARELPANEEPWEVPAPVEVKAETIGKHLSSRPWTARDRQTRSQSSEHIDCTAEFDPLDFSGLICAAHPHFIALLTRAHMHGAHMLMWVCSMTWKHSCCQGEGKSCLCSAAHQPHALITTVLWDLFGSVLWCGGSAVIVLLVFAVSSLVRPSGAVQEEEMQTQHNKEDRLVCWPPKASLNKTGGISSGTGCGWRLMNTCSERWLLLSYILWLWSGS